MPTTKASALRLAVWSLAAALAATMCTANRPYNETYITLQNCVVYYQMTLGIGQPMQFSTFLVDTGSHILWVPDSSCRCGASYNERKSNTYQKGNLFGEIRVLFFVTEYGGGTIVQGYFGTEHIRLNSVNLSITQCPMLFVTKQMSKFLYLDGIAGFGVPRNTFLDRAYQTGLIKSPNFILRLQEIGEQSAMYYNILPPDILARTQYLPLSSSVAWYVNCLGVVLDGEDYTSEAGSDMLVDSGTTLLILNQQLFEAMMARSFRLCQYINASSQLLCPRTVNLPTIRLYSRGLELQIHPDTYAAASRNLYTLQIRGGSSTILGAVFFKNYNVTFDKVHHRVGLDGPMKMLTEIDSELFFSSVIAVLILMSYCLLTLVVLCCVHISKVKQR